MKYQFAVAPNFIRLSQAVYSHCLLAGMAMAILFVSSVAVCATITVTSQEMVQKKAWVRQNLLTATNLPPFSFTYHGQAASKVLASWVRKEEDTVLDANRMQHVITWTNDVLQVRCVAIEYNDYPMLEWTVYLKNIGATNTPLLQSIQGLDVTFTRASEPEFVLNGIKGDWTTPDSYEPYQVKLNPSTVTNFSPLSFSGKSSSGPDGWPYYNLQMPGGGVILAIGWPGQWASSFARDATNGLRIRAGQERTHLYLKPGEEIRTPLIAMLFWKGSDVVRAQNIWRRFYLAYVIPRVNGRPPDPIAQIQVSGSDTNAVNAFLQADIHLDVCWRDAGGSYTWYQSSNGPYKGDDSWLNTGTWEVDATKYPDGFKPFSDWIRGRGLKFLLWFEPERVGDPDSWLGKNHPEWLLHGMAQGSILNEGDPAALRWLTNHINELIKSQGIDWYREDMNGDGPLPAWRNHDSTDRQGITENFYVQGHLAYWDALLAMNPGLRIDSCASGGRRNDLESMRRAVPLTRSDFQFVEMQNVVDGNQCHTYGLSSWLPFQGSGCRFYEPYSFRTFYMAEFGMCDGISPENIAAQKQAYGECKKIAPIMLFGDYYPLTPYSLADDVWMAWQFDRSDTWEGCVQAFRRSNCEKPSNTFRLNGLDPAAFYEVTNFDVAGSIKISGKTLGEKGLTIEIKEKRGSAVIAYKRIKASAGKTEK